MLRVVLVLGCETRLLRLITELRNELLRVLVPWHEMLRALRPLRSAGGRPGSRVVKPRALLRLDRDLKLLPLLSLKLRNLRRCLLYTFRAHETRHDLVCRLLLEKQKN